MKYINEYVMQASNFHPIKLDEYLSTKVKHPVVLFGIGDFAIDKCKTKDEAIACCRNSGFIEIIDETETVAQMFDLIRDTVDKYKHLEEPNFVIYEESKHSTFIRLFNKHILSRDSNISDVFFIDYDKEKTQNIYLTEDCDGDTIGCWDDNPDGFFEYIKKTFIIK